MCLIDQGIYFTDVDYECPLVSALLCVFFQCAIPQSGKNVEKKEGNRHHYTFLLLNLVRHKLNTEKK